MRRYKARHKKITYLHKTVQVVNCRI